MHILIGHISRTQSFQQNRHIHFHALVALKLLVSLISRLVACSARIVVDRQTNKQTHRTTTVTLAAQARRGLMTVWFLSPAIWPLSLFLSQQLFETGNVIILNSVSSGKSLRILNKKVDGNGGKGKKGKHGTYVMGVVVKYSGLVDVLLLA